jgi:RimJ/RimL family protein N-acetyltransferase
MIIETPRLRLRPMIDADLEPFLTMAADPQVMRYVSPTPIPRASAEAAAKHHGRQLETKGYTRNGEARHDT